MNTTLITASQSCISRAQHFITEKGHLADKLVDINCSDILISHSIIKFFNLIKYPTSNINGVISVNFMSHDLRLS